MILFYPKPRDKYWLYGRKNRVFVLIVSTLVIIAAIVYICICSYIARDYSKAPYKADVTAKLAEISESDTGYEYSWDYDINGKSNYWCSTSSASNEHQIGDEMDLRLWSDDGVSYYRTYYSPFMEDFYYISIVAAIVAAFFVLYVIIVKIRLSDRKKRKRHHKS